MNLKRHLYGPDLPQGPSHGRDVSDFVKRTLHRLSYLEAVGEDFFPKPKGGFDRVYNAKTEDAIETWRRLEARHPFVGPFRQDDLDSLWQRADAYAKWVYRVWKAPNPKPPEPTLIAPLQGLASLDKSLWSDFSLGRNMGLSDLGTFNPSSRLPSGAPSDHAVWPACAFDLGVDPDNGYSNPTGRAFFNLMVNRPGIHYVILGDKIWSREKGLHAYTSGDHMNHVHTSGNR